MSIKVGGAFRRSGGIVSAIGKQLKLVNLKAVQRITVSFDPFHESAVPTREFLHHLSAPKITQTNPTCVLKTEVFCDRRPPSIVFQLIPSVQAEAKLKKIELSSENLSTLELLKLCNRHVSALAPKEIVTSAVKTKSEKKAVGGAGGKRR
uniref:Large ribosomal subunit protein mL53 n=2 Tax=Anopheles triannulatus TaxID=58253 RepID=A0A2M4AXU2_9DIPT